MGLLEGKRALVAGVANKFSLAWGIAQALDREGAELVLTYHRERSREHLERLVSGLVRPARLVELDVQSEESLDAMADEVAAMTDRLDVVVHSLAHARPEDMEARFRDTSREGWALAQDVSVYSLVALTRVLQPLLGVGGDQHGASVMTLSYLGGDRVLPNYNVMGPAKAALEAAVRYLAVDLGRENVRVNALSTGPVKTLRASGVKGFGQMRHELEARAPLGRNITAGDVGNAAVFLASDWATNITGQVLFVDAGYHVMGI
jgi:enoyl-[acyl-carrier protein] reductase I